MTDTVDHDEDLASASRLPEEARRALATLLTSRFVSRSRHRAVWDALLAYESEIRERLADMYLQLVVDTEYEVAFKRQDPAEDAPRVLRRDRPLSRDASLLLIHLRREHVFADTRDEPVLISRTQIAEFLRAFREDGDADEAKFDRRVDTAIRAVLDLRLLTADPDAEYLFQVSPAVVPLIGAEELLRLQQYFTAAAAGEVAADPETVSPAEEPEPDLPGEAADPEPADSDTGSDTDARGGE